MPDSATYLKHARHWRRAAKLTTDPRARSLAFEARRVNLMLAREARQRECGDFDDTKRAQGV